MSSQPAAVLVAGAAPAVQLGRLSGLTNRKARHERGYGSYPYALLHHAAACVDPAGAALVAECAPDSYCAVPIPRPPLPAGHRATSSTGTRLILRPPETEYGEGLRRVLASLPAGTSLDRLRADYAVARRLLVRGAAPAQVMAVLAVGPRAREMPARAAAIYVERTVAAAAALVACARERQYIADHAVPGSAEGK